MELTIAERVALSNILPVQSNAATLRIVTDLRMELSFTEEELEEYGIENKTLPDGRAIVSWNPEKASETKDFKIGKKATGVIVSELTRLDSRGQLHITMLPLYEKFVEDRAEP